MSKLTWVPLKQGNVLDYRLVDIINRHYSYALKAGLQLTERNIPYLIGISSATPHENVRKDVDMLVEAINKYDAIIVRWEE